MKRKVFLSILLPGALAVTAFLGFATVRTVSASASNQTTSAADEHRGGPRGGGYTNEDLATALGITVDELTAAQESAFNTALDQAVDQGLITQAQADALRSRGSVFPFGRLPGGWLSENGIDFDALLASELGISSDELEQARGEARVAAIDRALAEGTITEEQADLLKGQQALASNSAFQTAMRSAFEAAVNAAVQAGVITQSQADRILENSSGSFFPGGRGLGGFGGGRGGHHGFGGGGLQAEPSQSAPSVTPSSG